MSICALVASKIPSSASALVLPAVPGPVTWAYAICFGVGVAVFCTIAEREVSCVLTLSAIAQCLGVALLYIQSLGCGSAVGISAKALLLDAIAISFRLCSTLYLDGYLPTDRSGDYIYQSFEICSLVMLLFLLHRVLGSQRSTYQEADDTLNIVPIVGVCLAAGALLHADMDDNYIFDTLWMTGLFTSVVAVLPQFWLIMRSGGLAGALTSHYIAAMALSRFLSGCFAWMAREHITCVQYINGFEHAIWAIAIAHVVHAILLADFAWFYARNVVRGGAFKPITINV
jgi:hypothetical protein